MNIFEKMLAITSELGVVAKNLNVDMGKGKSYKAVQEKDVLDAIKPLEEKYGVYSYPKERKIVDSAILEKETQYGVSKNMYLRIETTYEFVNVNNPEEKIQVISYADGIDSGDKATGKAMTYSDKYALLKAYKVATGDDPDKDASPENGYSKSEITTKEEARNLKLIFGKHAGRTIGELVDEKSSYINYLFQHGTPDIKKAITLLTGIVDVPLEEQKDKLGEMPITEAQKQQIKDKFSAEEIKNYLIDIDKRRLGELSYGEANDLIEQGEDKKLKYEVAMHEIETKE